MNDSPSASSSTSSSVFVSPNKCESESRSSSVERTCEESTAGTSTSRKSSDAPKKAIKCEFEDCDFVTSYPNKLRLHVAKKHTKGRFSCDKCGISVDTHVELRSHLSKAHPLVHLCDECGFTTSRPFFMRRHYEQAHSSGIVCPVPGCNSLMVKRIMKRHFKFKHPGVMENECSKKIIVNPNNEMKCTEANCDFTCNDFGSMDDHYRCAHSNHATCPVQDCNVLVPSCDMHRHIISVHENNGSEHSSSRCEDKDCGEGIGSLGDTATASSASDVEANVGEEEEPSEVSTSDETDENSASTAKVEKLEIGSLNPWSCSRCNATFSSGSYLRKHVRSVHFGAYSNYRRKVRHHCTYEGCDKSFSSIGLLDDHLNSHKGVMPYSCAHCNQSFFARSRYAVHLKKYHLTSIKQLKIIDQLRPSNS